MPIHAFDLHTNVYRHKSHVTAEIIQTCEENSTKSVMKKCSS